MITPPSKPAASVEPNILSAVIACQAFIERVSRLSVGVLESSIRELAAEIQPSPTPQFVNVLRALFLDLALESGRRLHASFHGTNHHHFAFQPDRIVTVVWADGSQTPRMLLSEWARRITAALSYEHEACQRLAQWILSNYQHPLRFPERAKELGLPEHHLARRFRVHFRMSPAEYHRGVRLVRAFEMLVVQKTKVEAVALSVGYHSKKNFYRSFKTWFPNRPTALRYSQFQQSTLLYRSLPRIPSTFRPDIFSILKKAAETTPHDVKALTDPMDKLAAQTPELQALALHRLLELQPTVRTHQDLIRLRLLEKRQELEAAGLLPFGTRLWAENTNSSTLAKAVDVSRQGHKQPPESAASDKRKGD
jgi:AraC-like DNA-binding protein